MLTMAPFLASRGAGSVPRDLLAPVGNGCLLVFMLLTSFFERPFLLSRMQRVRSPPPSEWPLREVVNHCGIHSDISSRFATGLASCVLNEEKLLPIAERMPQ